MRSLRVSQLVLLTVVLGCKLKSIHGVKNLKNDNDHHQALDAKRRAETNTIDSNILLSHVIEKNLFNGQKRYQQWHDGVHGRPVHVAPHNSVHRYKDDDMAALNGHVEKNLRAGQLRYHRIRATKDQTSADNQVKTKRKKLHQKHSPVSTISKHGGTSGLQNLIERNLMAGELRYNEMKARGDDDEEGVRHHTSNLRKTRKPPTTGTQSTLKLSSASPHTTLPKPIMAVGFPKAGTSSIFSFFHCSGLRSMHWYCCGEQTHPQFGGTYWLARFYQNTVQFLDPDQIKMLRYRWMSQARNTCQIVCNAIWHKISPSCIDVEIMKYSLK